MFHTARLKLTAWYLLIIMAISLLFSVFIYRIFTLELQRRLEDIESRLELRKFGFFPPLGQTRIFIHDIEEARKRLLFILIYTNGAIFLFSSLAGYFLAGKTLGPIEEVLENQKRFIADAGHELKTPLTSLQTSIEVSLRDKRLNLENARKTLSESLEDVEKLKSLTKSLLSLVKYQHNGSNLSKEEFTLGEIVEKVSKGIKLIAKRKKIRFDIKFEDAKVNANRESIEKLISIFLDNALKYTPANGSVSLSLKKKMHFLEIKVSDTGTGIAKKYLPHIFKRFYRVDTSRSKFGLGLSIARKIIELNKGTISVKSEINKGSTFTVRLPVS
ncbi:MAG: integral membrane sensor signal transduction histidine kinase [Candidatus Levybacteria bacterium GW2011_GWA2_40_8]|nr:MAG: integral membrane sensor signal transduction histidine kinase [Candidatus Levybacteria bacterium GW2011_GWA2_40_8]